MANFEKVELEWPSKRIPPGGVLHNHKAGYTENTRQFIKLLMDEAKFTLMQKREMNLQLRCGSSISDFARRSRQRNEDCGDATKNKTMRTFRPRTSRRRALSTIVASDAFQIERYRPKQRNEDRNVMKKKLQDIMEFGKNLPPEVSVKTSVLHKKTLPSKKEALNFLLTQIQERSEWLQEMEELGEGAKHREVINDQIAERIRRIEALKLTDDDISIPINETENEKGEKSLSQQQREKIRPRSENVEKNKHIIVQRSHSN